MVIPILVLVISVVILYEFRSLWFHLFEESHDETTAGELYNRLKAKQLCPKCGEEMEEGRAIINYRDDKLPFLSPHEIPTFLRTNIRMGPTLTGNPFYPEPRKIFRCHACGTMLDARA